MIDLNTLSADIHRGNVEAGWWDDFAVKTDRHRTAMMLVVSELAEAMEGVRKDLMDDHLPCHKMFNVELADALIRLLDLAGAYELTMWCESDVAPMIGRVADNWGRRTQPEQLYIATRTMLNAKNGYDEVYLGILGVLVICRINDIDIWPIVAQKRAYNTVRADHKRENRADAGGKQF